MDSSKYVRSEPLMIPYTFEGKNICLNNTIAHITVTIHAYSKEDAVKQLLISYPGFIINDGILDQTEIDKIFEQHIVTVKDLIDELSKYDENLPVMMNYCDPIDKVILNGEHYFGDSANPECKVGPAVELI